MSNSLDILDSVSENQKSFHLVRSSKHIKSSSNDSKQFDSDLQFIKNLSISSLNTKISISDLELKKISFEEKISRKLQNSNSMAFEKIDGYKYATVPSPYSNRNTFFDQKYATATGSKTRSNVSDESIILQKISDDDSFISTTQNFVSSPDISNTFTKVKFEEKTNNSQTETIIETDERKHKFGGKIIFKAPMTDSDDELDFSGGKELNIDDESVDNSYPISNLQESNCEDFVLNPSSNKKWGFFKVPQPNTQFRSMNPLQSDEFKAQLKTHTEKRKIKPLQTISNSIGNSNMKRPLQSEEFKNQLKIQMEKRRKNSSQTITTTLNPKKLLQSEEFKNQLKMQAEKRNFAAEKKEKIAIIARSVLNVKIGTKNMTKSISFTSLNSPITPSTPKSTTSNKNTSNVNSTARSPPMSIFSDLQNERHHSPYTSIHCHQYSESESHSVQSQNFPTLRHRSNTTSNTEGSTTCESNFLQAVMYKKEEDLIKTNKKGHWEQVWVVFDGNYIRFYKYGGK
ncbi:hypothetical protein HK096_007913, partial [Nowakowskiella sp. JEL0078]